MEARVVEYKTSDPHGTALQAMRRAALQAAHTWTIREFVATIASRAPPRDYVAQLRLLYNEIVHRWRYVMEPSEFVHGTGSSLLAHVLGTKYNTPPGTDPTRVRVTSMPSARKGWGDCDDVATLVAAVAIAIGMPGVFFRIAQNGKGAHVSVLVRTPRGEFISMDPVGHPDHPFNWAQPADRISLYDVQTGRSAQTQTASSMGAFEGSDDSMKPETYFIGPGNTLTNATARSHWAATDLGDIDGPRSLTIPMREWRMFRRGIGVHGCPAVDENGKTYKYCADRDLWVRNALRKVPRLQKPPSMGGVLDEVEPVPVHELTGPFGRRSRAQRRQARAQRRAGRGVRRKKRRTRFRKFFKRIGKGFRKVMAKILKSKWVQNIVAGILKVMGVPMRLTKGVIAAGASIIEQGGITGFIRLLRKDKKAAMKMIAAAGKAGLKGAGLDLDKLRSRRRRRMSGFGYTGGDVVPLTGIEAMGAHDSTPMNTGTGYRIRQAPASGRWSNEFSAAPVVSLVGALGVIDAQDATIASTPTPGMYYQIRKGNTLLGTARAAYGTSGGTNVKRAKWINNAKANAAFQIPSENKWFQPTILTYLPRFATDPGGNVRGQEGNNWAIIWIPEAPGDEPPEIPWDDPQDTGDTIPDIPDADSDPVDPATDDLPQVDPTDPGTGQNEIPDIIPPETDIPGDPVDPNQDTGDDSTDDTGDTDTIPDTNGGDTLVGPRGETGAQGIPGETGTQGIPGVIGPGGPSGPAGPTGPGGEGTSIPGERGEMGPTGSPGIQGGQGPEGSVGPMGPSGVPGSTGPAGPPGADGTGGGNGNGAPPLAILALIAAGSGLFK